VKTILTLDLGTRTGWAYRNTAGVISHGVADFGGKRGEPKGARFKRFQVWLDSSPATVLVDRVVYEGVCAHNGVYAAHMWGGWEALLCAWCEANGTPYEDMGVGTIKKDATGNGRASKQDVISAVRAAGFQPTDDNDADALAIMLAVTKGEAR